MKNKNKKYLILALLNFFLFVLIIILLFQIKNIHSQKVKGVSYQTVIPQESLFVDNETKDLKYYYELKPNTVMKWAPKWLGQEIENTTNSDGLNEKEDYATNKPHDTYRIITLGDSFTFGQYVETEKNYTEVLENMLNSRLVCPNNSHFEVINLAVPGHNIEYSVERFRRKGVAYQTDLLIWMINEWNLEKADEYIRPIKKRLRNEGVPLFDPINQTWLNTKLALKELLEKYGEDFLLNYQKKALFKMGKYYQGNLLVVSFPSIKNKYKNIILDFVASNKKYSYYDSLVDISINREYHFLDHHPNTLGHLVMANDLFDYLFNNYFTSCNQE